MRSICTYFILFIIYSFLGWIYESSMRTIKDKKWVNRGFLFGPIIPIYGIGAALAVIVTDFVDLSWYQLFIAGFIISGIMEYITSYVLEKLFHAYWWDYHQDPLNINGRTDIIYDALFGLAGLLIVYVLNPFIGSFVNIISDNVQQLFSLLLMAALSIDLSVTVNCLSEFDKRVVEINEKWNQKMQQRYLNAEDLLDDYKEMISNLPKPTLITLNKIKGFKHKKIDNDKLKTSIERIKSLAKEKIEKNRKKN